MARAFIAVEVPPLPPLLRALSALRDLGRALRPVAPENLHITLRFLGETPVEQFGAIERVLRAAAAQTPAFTFELAGMGLFPDMRHPTVIWAGARADEPLAALVQAICPGLAALGFQPETRPFVCHLTLARIKARPPAELRHFLDQRRDELFGAVPVKQVKLMLSEISPQGPHYRVAAEVGLQV